MAICSDVDVYTLANCLHQMNPSLCTAVNEPEQCFCATLRLVFLQEKSSGEVVGAVVIAVISLSPWNSPWHVDLWTWIILNSISRIK